MSVTVLAKKTVGFRSPYTGDTFQDLTAKIIGRDGYMSGGVTTDDTVDIVVGPITVIQRGLIAETEVNSPPIPVPVGAEPWFIVAAIPDDDPGTGVVFSATRDLVSAANGVVVAFKTSGIWQNPVSVDIRGASAKASEPGVESGAQPYFTLSGDNMDEVILNRGRIVDPDGIRRDLPREAASSTKNFGVTAVRAHPTLGRMDHIVLRQRESHSPETKHLIGPLFDDASYSAFTKTGTRQAYYAKRGGTNDEQWFAYGSGSDLHIMGGPAGGGFADAVLLTAAGTVGEAWIAGQRAADDAIILLYTDGILLRMVSFDAATGAQIDAPVTLDLDGNTISHVRAEMDGLELVHIVYERDDGGAPTQQVYYTKRSSAAASFADAALTHRIVHGSATGKNDTYPDIDVDRYGNAHIVYTTGLLTNTYGDLVYAVYDQTGNLVVEQTHLVGSAVGVQASATDNIGFVATVYGSFHRCRVTVTDFDEVFCVVAGGSALVPEDLLLFSPGFQGRLGFPMVNIGFSAAGSTLYGADIVSNELGELRIAYASSTGGFFLSIGEIGLDTVFAPDGLLGQSRLRTAGIVVGSIVVYTPGTDEDDIILRRGTIGDVRLSYRRNGSNAAYVYEIGTLDVGSNAIASTPHPKDIYLASFDVADNATGIIPEETIRIHNVRQKKMNYPFLVGIDGDFQGTNSIYEAVRRANVNGGEIVVRKGDYRNLFTGAFPGTIALASGVTLRGEGQVVFEDGQFSIGNSLTNYSINNIDGNIVERTATFGSALRAGDVVEMATSGFHRVLAVLPPKGSYAGRLYLDASSPGDAVPAGANLVPYPSGNKLENIAIRSNIGSSRILVYKSYQAVLRDISFFGVWTPNSSSQVIDVDGAHHVLLDNIDFTKQNGVDANSIAVHLDNCFRPVLRGLRCVAGEVDGINLKITNDTPSISDSTGIKFQNTSGGTRTTPVAISNVDDGDLTPISPDTDFFTGVGSLIRAPFNERMYFEDKLTRAASGPIALAGAAAAFDGATPQVIVDSVNERIKASGDAMSGNLTTNGTTRELGATGAAGNRFDVFANLLNVLGVSTLQNALALGGALLGSIANGDVARVDVAASVFAGVEYTLMWQSVPSAQKGFRLYVSPTGTLLLSVNAVWNNTTDLWAKDVNGEPATEFRLENGQFKILYQAGGVNSWADSAWTSSLQENSMALAADEAVGVTPRPKALWKAEDGVEMYHVDHLGFPTTRYQRFSEHWYELNGAFSAGEAPKWNVGLGGTASVAAGTMSTSYRAPHINGTVPGTVANSVSFETQIPIVQYGPNSIIVASWIQSSQNNNMDQACGLGNLAGLNSVLFTVQETAGEFQWQAQCFDGAGTSSGKTNTFIDAGSSSYQRFRVELYGANQPGGARAVFMINGAIKAVITSNLPAVNANLTFGSQALQTVAYGGTNHLRLGQVEVFSNHESHGPSRNIPLL